MIDLCGEMIVLQFGKYNYICKLDSKPELISYWVRDSTAWIGRGKEEVFWQILFEGNE